MDDVATAIANNTVELPVGTLQGTQQAYQIGANSQLLGVNQLSKVIVAYRNGAPVRIRDLGRVVEGSDAPLQVDWVNNHIGEMIGIWRQPGSNTLQLVDRVKAMLPRLQAGIPPSIKLIMVSDRSLSISASFNDVKLTLAFTIFLVVMVIFIVGGGNCTERGKEQQTRDTFHQNPTRSESRGAVKPRSNLTGDSVQRGQSCPPTFRVNPHVVER